MDEIRTTRWFRRSSFLLLAVAWILLGGCMSTVGGDAPVFGDQIEAHRVHHVQDGIRLMASELQGKYKDYLLATRRDRRQRLAMMATTDERGKGTAQTVLVDEQLQNRLHAPLIWAILERKDIERLYAEHKLAESDLSLSDERQRVGRLLQSDMLLFGRLVRKDPTKFLLSVKLIDIESGELIATSERNIFF